MKPPAEITSQEAWQNFADAELRQAKAEIENLRHRAETISSQYDACRVHAAKLEAKVSELSLRPPVGVGWWRGLGRRLKYLVTGL